MSSGANAGVIDRIATAMTDVGPQVRAAMVEHPEFAEIGTKLGMDALRTLQL